MWPDELKIRTADPSPHFNALEARPFPQLQQDWIRDDSGGPRDRASLLGAEEVRKPTTCPSASLRAGEHNAIRPALTECRSASLKASQDYAIRPATMLAPMAGVTDTVFRRVIRSLGA